MSFGRSDSGGPLSALRFSVRTPTTSPQNLFPALTDNTAMIPLASPGLLQPVVAAAAMVGSSVSVLANSLAFRIYAPEDAYRVGG